MISRIHNYSQHLKRMIWYSLHCLNPANTRCPTQCLTCGAAPYLWLPILHCKRFINPPRKNPVCVCVCYDAKSIVFQGCWGFIEWDCDCWPTRETGKMKGDWGYRWGDFDSLRSWCFFPSFQGTFLYISLSTLTGMTDQMKNITYHKIIQKPKTRTMG